MALLLMAADRERGFTPPAGLGASRPRDVRLTAGGRVVAALAAALLVGAVAAGVVLQRVANAQQRDRLRLAESGAVTDGTVIDLGRSGGDSKRYWVSYRFRAGGRQYEGRATIAAPHWRALAPEDPLPIRYVREAPAFNTPAWVEPSALPVWLPSLIALAIATLTGACVLLLHTQRRLLSEGRVSPARVTRHTITRTSHGGKHSAITYEFALMSGATRTGRSSVTSKLPAVGSVICVLYDPERPSRSAPYPLPFARLR